MARACTCGMMGRAMRESIVTICDTATGSLHGRIKSSIKESGPTTSSGIPVSVGHFCSVSRSLLRLDRSISRSLLTLVRTSAARDVSSGRMAGRTLGGWKGTCVTVRAASSGAMFVGSWDHGVPNGEGTFTWPDGMTWQGNYKDGSKHGEGIFRAPDAVEFAGSYSSDKRHGDGQQRWPDGREFYGSYHFGELYGPGVYVRPDGSTYATIYYQGGGRHVVAVPAPPRPRDAHCRRRLHLCWRVVAGPDAWARDTNVQRRRAL